MATEVIETGIILWTALKYLVGVMGTIILGLLGWNYNKVTNDVDSMKISFNRHEIDAAEKFATLQANMKLLMDTIPRIHERLDDLHDLKNYLKYKGEQ